jgi:hypothetical protein
LDFVAELFDSTRQALRGSLLVDAREIATDTSQRDSRAAFPGPESSFGKLFATELNLRVAMFADELLGPYGTLDKGSIGAVEGGRWMTRTLSARAHDRRRVERDSAQHHRRARAETPEGIQTPQAAFALAAKYFFSGFQ